MFDIGAVHPHPALEGSPAGCDSTGHPVPPWLPFPGSQSCWNPSQCQASWAALH